MNDQVYQIPNDVTKTKKRPAELDFPKFPVNDRQPGGVFG
jgi:hypothetical protein